MLGTKADGNLSALERTSMEPSWRLVTSRVSTREFPVASQRILLAGGIAGRENGGQ